MPRYEFSEGASNKFWEITLKGSDVVTTYGRIGAAGQSTTKSFESSSQAQSAYHKLIEEKTKKGYLLTAGGEKVPVAQAQPAAGELAERLSRIDTLLKDADPDAFASLKPGASDAALKPLSDACFGGKKLPADLLAFFRWHDGQSKVESLSQDNNRTPMSAAEALAAWQYLSDPKAEITRSFAKTWLPIFTNGAGDYLTYESAGKNPGALIGYWHTDEDRDVEYRSLTVWAIELEDSLAAEVKKRKKAPKKAKFELDISQTAWKKASSPDQATLTNKPVGTAYYYCRRFFALEHPFFRAFVKVAPDVWYFAMTTKGLNEAIGEIVTIANKVRQPMGFEWKKNDRFMAIEELLPGTVRADLTDFQTKQRKWSTAHVGLYEAEVKVFQAAT